MKLTRTLHLTAVALLASASPAISQASQTQTIPLSAGWNLIAFQVNPSNPSPSAVFGVLGTNFKAAFTYDATTKQWTSYQNPTLPGADPAANTLPGVAMGNIQLGKGYWVWVSNATSSNPTTAGSWNIAGTIPAITPGVTTAAGWNLIGVPSGAATGFSERIGLLSVLTRAGFNYDQLLKWEPGPTSYKKAAVTKSDGSSAIGDPEMRFFDHNAGYWVNVTDPALLQPKLNVTLRPDFNLEPYTVFPGPEDLNVSGAASGTPPRTAVNQTVVRFFPGEDIQTISLSNTGGGILIWSAEFVPDQYSTLTAPWLTLSDSAAEMLAFNANGTAARDYKKFDGVTTVENDLLFLRLDRKNLPVGTYTGKLKLLTSAASTQLGNPVPGLQEYSVIAEVPAIEGEFRGYAKIETVNGKRNRVPDIDLAVGVYGDAKVPSMLRGFIDSRNALLWPQDVPLAGYYQSSQGNAFQLSGGFILPPGDQNFEPYDTLLGTAAAHKDVDWDDDGQVDALNPLPYPVQRSVFFDGKLASGDPMSGYEITGRYTEVIHGMMREAITLEGTFSVRREKPSAFESRTTLLGGAAADTRTNHVNQAVWTPVPPTQPNFTIAAGATQIRDVNVATEMELKGLTVAPEWGSFATAGTEHGQFRLKLFAPVPDGGGPRPELVLYDSNLSAVGWATLKNLLFPDSRPFQGNLTTFLSSLTQTTGTWSLSVQNLADGSVTLPRWSLRLYGQPVFDVHGRVLSGATGVAGAQVSIAGQPLANSVVSGADGSFVFRRVPGMPLNITATHPAYTSNLAGLAPSFLLPGLSANSAAENSLLSRFQPLAGLAPAGLGVYGFSQGSSTGTALPLQLTPASSSPAVRIVPSTGLFPAATGTNPRGYVISWGAVEVDFTALHATSPVQWNLGDGTTATTNPVPRTYLAPKIYPVTLQHPVGTAVDRVDVVVMPTIRNVPANVSQVDPAKTGYSNYTVFCFNPSFTGGGSLPEPNPDGNPVTADNPIIPTSYANNASAPHVDFVMLQHCHAASFDLDLAPLIPPAANPQNFSADNFDQPLQFSAHASNRASSDGDNFGFEEEDHNYTLRNAPDRLPPAPVLPQWVAEDVDLAQTINVADDQGWSQEDARYSPLNRPSSAGSTLSQATSRYIMTCSIGAAISPYPMSPPTVETSDAYDASPTLRADYKTTPVMDSGLARNLYLQLTVGPLAALQGQPFQNQPVRFPAN